jgi:hypothetical protein
LDALDQDGLRDPDLHTPNIDRLHDTGDQFALPDL